MRYGTIGYGATHRDTIHDTIRNDSICYYTIRGHHTIRTLNFHHRRDFDDSEIAGSRAGVVSGLLHVCEYQHVSTDWQIVIRSEIRGWTFLPFDIRHRRTHGDAGQIQRSTRSYFADGGRRNGKSWRDSSNCVQIEFSYIRCKDSFVLTR